tara:strand:- start:75 stop:491 length:417 start_codon:yes stop_codon:yes gene_type:complete
MDPDAQEISINFAGGSVVMTIGLARAIFGDDSSILRAQGIDTSVSVRGHQRVRVIGGTPTTVGAYSYNYTQWPVGASSQAAGGEPIMIRAEGTNGWWTARLKGSCWEFGTFLNAQAPNGTTFKTEAGTAYGPFRSEDI